MRPPGTVTVFFLRTLVNIANASGITTEAICGALRIPQDVLADPDGWVSVDLLTRAWICVPQLSQDRDFGLHAGERLPFGHFGALEYAAVSSPNLATAFERAARYYRVMGAMVDFTFMREGDFDRVVLRPLVAKADDLRHYFENFFAIAAMRAPLLLGGPVRPERVCFAHAAPADVSEHRRIFDCPVTFAHPRYEMVYRAADLQRPLVTANPEFLRSFEAEDKRLGALDADSVAQRVRNVLPSTLRQGDASVKGVARKLAFSTRSLQRRLMDEGVSFTDLVDEVRREEARRYVAEGRLSLGEIAFVLGFSQPSAFFRAFKRWTGATPGEFRSGRAAPTAS